jgi:hypothetical protein
VELLAGNILTDKQLKIGHDRQRHEISRAIRLLDSPTAHIFSNGKTPTAHIFSNGVFVKMTQDAALELLKAQLMELDKEYDALHARIKLNTLELNLMERREIKGMNLKPMTRDDMALFK